MAEDYVIEMLHITKEFPGIKANDDITLQLRKGEVHALLGENGAGKSTLMSVLFGLYQPEQGKILKNGKEVAIRNPNDANALGIGMVHQEFMLLPGFTVTENIKLNREITHPNLISRIFGKNLETLDMKAMAADARKRFLQALGEIQIVDRRMLIHKTSS